MAAQLFTSSFKWEPFPHRQKMPIIKIVYNRVILQQCNYASIYRIQPISHDLALNDQKAEILKSLCALVIRQATQCSIVLQ